ncbi:SGNH/GDSL hydrolase family protein [Fredinandcohnia humi]
MKVALWGDSLTDGKPGVAFVNVLKERLPDIQFVNYGKPGDTLKSMYKRLYEEKVETRYDMVFIWIGVNDIYSKALGVKQHPVVRDEQEFKDYYQKVIELAQNWTSKIIIVTPAIIGEQPENQWNKELGRFVSIMKELPLLFSNVILLDIHKLFVDVLKDQASSNYITLKPLKVIGDVLFIKKPEKVEKKSKSRGLILTLDGVHLNGKGANLVAKYYEEQILSYGEGALNTH